MTKDTGVLGCGAGQHGGLDTFLSFCFLMFLNEQGYTGVLGCGAGQHGGFDTFFKVSVY
jgi:hypothetical protein